MSADISSAIVVGYTYKEVMEIFDGDRDKFENEVHCECNLMMVSPYYDAEESSCLFGVLALNTDDYSYKEFKMELVDVQSVIYGLVDKYGKVPKVYLTPFVT